MKKNLLIFCFFTAVILNACTPYETVTSHVITFEEAPESLLANSPYGDNLYDGSYPGYVNNVTGLGLGYLFSSFDYGGYLFTTWNGGAVSRWNDTATEGYTNQCSVYYENPYTGQGGYNGTATFAIIYVGENSTLYFKEPGEEKVIESIYVNNSTYTALSMIKGDAFAKVFKYEDGDWLKLICTGLDATGNETGQVTFYLADFRTPQSGGVVTSWSKVDLSSLGKVHSIAFTMESSDTGAWGMNTPSYFCLDNIAVNME
jgi:hypothetical protein